MCKKLDNPRVLHYNDLAGQKCPGILLNSFGKRTAKESKVEDYSDLKFDKEFVFGAATASYQIEGAVWANGRGASIWDTYCRTPGKVWNGETGDVACDHYHRYEEDFDLMRKLGITGYRFSIAWPRIYPNGYGKVETRGLDFYDRLVDAMLAKGLSPNATLYHWDLPQKLEDEGGWFSRKTAEHYATYVETVLKRLGDRLDMIATLNEPWCTAFLGYLYGEQAPGKRNRTLFAHTAHHLNLAHGMALPIIRSLAPKAKAGTVLIFRHGYPASDSQEDYEACQRDHNFNNGIFLGPLFEDGYPDDLISALGDHFPKDFQNDYATIKQSLDFLGVNYYFSLWLKNTAGNYPNAQCVAKGLPVTGMGWEIYPEGIRDLLLRLASAEYVPELYITENGSAWPDTVVNGRVNDDERSDYLVRHLKAIREAIDQGVPVKGYYAWSLMDNFEWSFGTDKRFGLYYVDYATQQRIPKKSAEVYGQIIESSSGNS